ncbi:MAG: hypothetical protein EOP61_29335, partial [Sphingomonadales bacterium]
PQAVKVLIGTTELPPIGEPDKLVRAYSLKRDALVAIATAKPEDAGAVPDAASNVATDLRGLPLPPPAADATAPAAAPSDRAPVRRPTSGLD